MRPAIWVVLLGVISACGGSTGDMLSSNSDDAEIDGNSDAVSARTGGDTGTSVTGGTATQEGGSGGSGIGTGGVSATGGIGDTVSTGGTGGAAVDPLAPFPAPPPWCEGWTAYRVPVGTCLTIRGRYDVVTPPISCDNVIWQNGPNTSLRCGVVDNNGQCLGVKPAPSCQDGSMVIYVQATTDRPYTVTRADLVKGVCPKLELCN